jgi:DNA-binding HxlR family transcriptional regulator
MTKRKLTSTNSINREHILLDCDLMHAAFMIGGRWKLLIIGRLSNRELRFSELKKLLSNISERILVLHLKQLEKDGIVARTVYAEVPARVEYALTPIGKKLVPICDQLQQWGQLHKSIHSSATVSVQDEIG